MKKSIVLLLCLLMCLYSCFDSKESKSEGAIAIMESKSGSSVTGTVNFSETNEGLKVHYKFDNLIKNKSYGFHVHENGDCSSVDAKSAGKHYMPVAATGGTSIDSPEKHAGDLPPINAEKEGSNEGSFMVTEITLKAKNPIMGKAIILHEGPDDINSKSPPRIACGIIKLVD